MLPLVKTLFDIVLLRKGPDSIPRSSVLFILIVGLWLFSSLVELVLIDRIDENDFLIGLFIALVVVICYAMVVVVSGHSSRVLQTISAILGCNALISLAFVAEFVLFTPFLGESISGPIAELIVLWSVPVEGHIIARAIDRHWYIGIAIAISVVIFQLLIYSVMTSSP